MKNTLIQNKSDISNFPCPYCNNYHIESLFEAPAFDEIGELFKLVTCRTCGLVRTDPILDESSLSKYYDPNYYGSGEKKFSGIAEQLLTRFNARRAESLIEKIRGKNTFFRDESLRVIDIGCGRGQFLKSLNKLGCECHGVERDDFPEDGDFVGIKFYKDDLKRIGFDDNYFRAAIIWHVLEHLADPFDTLREVARIIKPGGLLAIAVPNFDSFQAKIFRDSWFHLDLPRHLFHFTPPVMTRFLEQINFKVTNLHTFSLDQNPYGFIQSVFNKYIGKSKPNAMYSLLKRNQGMSAKLSLLGWLGVSAGLAPLALMEYFISGLAAKGAALTIYARKLD